MNLLMILALQSAAPIAADDQILVTASRAPASIGQVGVSATVVDRRRIDALGEVQVIDLLRLVPGMSIAVSGARGAQAQVRIRGAEANHTLLFVDGIRFNDPASGNEARFETLSADGLGRIEIVRGPQSALWGSEALGGVIALESPDPLSGERFDLLGEYGGRDSIRGAFAGTIGDKRRGATLTVSHAESEGIDIVGGGEGDRDGFANTTLGFRSAIRPAPNGEFGFAARYIDSSNEFDGFDPLSFRRADTLDSSDTETAAARGWATLGIDPASPWSLTAEAQYLNSHNRNFTADTPLNRTMADRFVIGGQLERRLTVGESEHVLIAAIEREEESFTARDQQFLGATDQDRTRDRTAYIGEWRAGWTPAITTDLAVRHDDFSEFLDETTLRATARAAVAPGLSISGSYGEGIARPTFFDLFGFFPGSFVGNPALTPERSRAYEIGLDWRGERIALSAIVFSGSLEDEIVAVFDSATFLSSTANATGESDRRGIELAAGIVPVAGLRIDANYTFLDAEDQQVAGGDRVREIRRPRHSANLAFDWKVGRFLLGGAASYVGARRDVDFDVSPGRDVTLEDHVLASARVGFDLTERIEIYGRIDNLFDAKYQDVVGYATPGMTAYAGLRLRLGD